MVTKKQIEKARNRYWLKEAQKQLGSHIKSLNQVKVVKKTKPQFSLGKKLVITSKRLNIHRK